MTPIKAILNTEKDDQVRYTLDERKEATQYRVVEGILYKQGFTTPLPRCVTTEMSKDIMREVHEGVCGSHIGGASLAAKVLRAGFYWPTLRTDFINFVRECDKCQRFANIPRASPEELTSILAPWPFALWGWICWDHSPKLKASLNTWWWRWITSRNG